MIPLRFLEIVEVPLPSSQANEETMAAAIFTPFDLGHFDLPNRIVMPPMGVHWADQGIPGPEVAAYYARRAEGGASLIITEGTFIDHPVSGHNPGYLRIGTPSTNAGWSEVVRAVHAGGGRIMPELWHCGLVYSSEELRSGSEYDARRAMFSPSGLIMPGKRVGEAMSARQIEEVIDSFARAAVDARAVGFDGVELHGAHGFLIDQFFWEGLNDRSDAYGGSMRNRARFGAEVTAEVRRRTGPGCLLSMRISQWKMQDYTARVAKTPAELAEWLEPLVEAGIDLFDCSQRRHWEPEFEGSTLNFAGWVKKLTGKPVITVGSIGLNTEMTQSLIDGETAAPTGIDHVNGMLERGEVDLVAVGRALIGDPDWPKKIAKGQLDKLVGFKPQILKETSATYDYL